MSSKFIKTQEDFVCGKCGAEVEGNGYTNHCPECLWSKHVDIFPGDRKEDCGGMMEPIRVEKNGKEYTVIHKCQKCGAEKPNKAVKEDNFQMLVQISAENGRGFSASRALAESLEKSKKEISNGEIGGVANSLGELSKKLETD